MDFPGNSHTSKLQTSKEDSGATDKPETPTKKNITPVDAEGKITPRKKGVGTQIREMFVSEGENLRDWFIKDMLIPTVRGMIVAAFGQVTTGFQQALEEKLNPGERPSITRPPTGQTHIPYNRYASNAPVIRTMGAQTTVQANGSYQPRVVRRSNSVQQFVFESRQDAVNILLSLEGIIEKYGHATVGDYYNLIPDVVPKSTDEEWGWYNLNRARPVPLSGGGHGITFPEPEPINTGQ
ncbi:hypothetical protein SEA_GIRLPOWER_46 [Streptomyces phage GirlPower]|nr:hypothetical protein SEA_GIRLPOWER_46 [Streptomyces phage GirlPower]